MIVLTSLPSLPPSGYPKGKFLGPSLLLSLSPVAAQGNIASTEEESLTPPSLPPPLPPSLPPGYPNGNFLGPSLLQFPSPVAAQGNVAYTEEVFAPVLGVVCVETLDEAIKFVNARYAPPSLPPSLPPLCACPRCGVCGHARRGYHICERHIRSLPLSLPPSLLPCETYQFPLPPLPPSLPH